jgi:hypothetical protein
MLYIIKDNMLKPVIKEFEMGHNKMFRFNQMIECLKFNKINKLLTYSPSYSETVCSAPYEINNEEELEQCEVEGKWNRFSHLEIFLSKEEEKILKDNNLILIRLNEDEINKLESKLKFYH